MVTVYNRVAVNESGHVFLESIFGDQNEPSSGLGFLKWKLDFSEIIFSSWFNSI